MTDQVTTLRALLRQRRWSYSAFCTEYDKAARTLDPKLKGSWPSRAQFHRWMTGDLRGLPRPDACRVLEAMFPAWTVEQLLSPCSDEQLARIVRQTRAAVDQEAQEPPRFDVDQLIAERFSDVNAVYATRSEFISNMPVHRLFDTASKIRACGLSLNLICQQYADQRLKHLADTGTEIQCLFLDPDGTAIRDREREESFSAGHLSNLTRINIVTMKERVRDRLTEDAGSRLLLATYDETVRFNVILVDDNVGVVQPYLPGIRGVDSPTFVLHRRWPDLGLFPMFESVFCSLWEKSKPV